MENNAIIMGRFIDILNILDARARLSVFVEENGKQILYASCEPVYELLTAVNKETSSFYQIKRYDVIALNVGLTTSILLKKGE